MTNAVVALALETVGAGYSALIFCGSRDGCRRTAKLVSKAMPEGDEVKPGLLEERSKLVASLRSLMMLSLDEDLAGTVMRGVGFHRRSFFCR